MHRAFAWTALGTMLLAGCTQTEPLVRPGLPVPARFPGTVPATMSATLTAGGPEDGLPLLSYRAVLTDPALQSLVDRALRNNRDLRVATANVAAARANLRIRQADRLPTIEAAAGAARAEGGGSRIGGNDFSLGVGITAFEIDLFGRVAALTEAERNRYFATEAAQRAVRLALIGAIADAWLAHGADASLLAIASDTRAAALRSVALTRIRLDGGVAPRTDLRQAETVLATADADLADQQTALSQDRNLLALLVGEPVDAAALPASIAAASTSIAAPPVGLDSRVLLRRPDVVEADFALRAANADVGAARAALFPIISLTGALGLASNALGSLFGGGAFTASAGVDAGYPVFSGGRGRAGVALTRAQRDAAVASYEGTIQAAFRDVADALARNATLAALVRARALGVAAATDTLQLTEARYRGGIDPFLAVLDAQRSLYDARRAAVTADQVAAANRVAVYRAIGGDDAVAGGALAGPTPTGPTPTGLTPSALP